jgi:hypothetical protein
MDFELERFKVEINLTEYAAFLGYEIDREKTGSTRAASVTMRLARTGDKIIIRRDEKDGHWVYCSVRDPSDNGTIVDFTLRRAGQSLGRVRQELRAWLGDDRPYVPLRSYCDNLLPQTSDRTAVQATFRERTREVPNSHYLNLRGIRVETLQDRRFAGTWRIDSRGNAVFPHTDAQGLSGYELKNKRFTSFSARGSKTLWRSNDFPEDNRLVYCESAINALSYHQLKPDAHTRFRSTAGALGAHQPDVVRADIRAMPPGSTVILAFDNDKAGEHLAAELELLVPEAAFVLSTPKTVKDWNDVLQARERDFIASLV